MSAPTRAQLERLLDAVDALPARHDCPGLHACVDHPKWRVLPTRYIDSVWYSVPPGPETFPTPDEHTHEERARAFAHVRDAQLAAITHSEGTDALPTDLETP